MRKALTLTKVEYEALCKKMKVQPITQQATLEASAPLPKERRSKTEMLYERTYLRDVEHKYEAITFHMENGHKYTPDFYVPKEKLFIEVKGSYRLHSYGRALLAFHQAKIEFPEFRFVLATKTKDEWKFQ